MCAFPVLMSQIFTFESSEPEAIRSGSSWFTAKHVAAALCPVSLIFSLLAAKSQRWIVPPLDPEIKLSPLLKNSTSVTSVWCPLSVYWKDKKIGSLPVWARSCSVSTELSGSGRLRQPNTGSSCRRTSRKLSFRHWLLGSLRVLSLKVREKGTYASSFQSATSFWI